MVLAVIVHAELTCAPLLWAAQSCPTHRTLSWAPHAAGCAEGGPRPTCPSAASPEEKFAHLSQENRDQPSGCESRVLLRAVGPSSPKAVICSAHQHQLMAGPDLPISVTQHIQHSHACSSPLPCPGPFLSDCPPGFHPYTAAQPKLHLSTQLLWKWGSVPLLPGAGTFGHGAPGSLFSSCSNSAAQERHPHCSRSRLVCGAVGTQTTHSQSQCHFLPPL